MIEKRPAFEPLRSTRNNINRRLARQKGGRPPKAGLHTSQSELALWTRVDCDLRLAFVTVFAFRGQRPVLQQAARMCIHTYNCRCPERVTARLSPGFVVTGICTAPQK
jgi:hypothetical protein